MSKNVLYCFSVFYSENKRKPVNFEKEYLLIKPSTEKLVWPWKKKYSAQPASKHKSALKATRRPASGKHYNLKMHAKGLLDCCVTRLVEMQTEPQPR